MVHAVGNAELVAENEPGQFTLWVDGVPSSPIDVEHPDRLAFEYLAWMARVTDAVVGEGVPLQAVHLGAAGCALATAWDATRPGSRQLAVEVDEDLARVVREWFALPRAPRLRIRTGDARAVLATRRDGSADVVVRDAFAAGQTPDHLTTVGFLHDVQRVLRPGGLYLANVADRPPLRELRAEAASALTVFGSVCVVAEAATVRGRRHANSVVVARDGAVDVAAIHRQVALAGVAVRVLHGAELRRFVGTVPAREDPPVAQ